MHVRYSDIRHFVFVSLSLSLSHIVVIVIVIIDLAGLSAVLSPVYVSFIFVVLEIYEWNV